jgi:putative endonuclease
MCWIYVLKSKKDDKLYIGSTANLEQRLYYHNSGKVRSTKSRRPLDIVYKEQFDSVASARKRESFFKSGQGRKLLADLI